MSHVDEGELTAYADGAFAPTSADALRIEAHLSTCENCRNRLAQEQALTGRASEILAYAAPSMVKVPPFDDVIAHSHTRTLAHSRKRVPLAWAASVILAVGLGWFGHGALQDPAARQRSVVSEAPVVAEVPAEPPSRRAEPETRQAARAPATRRRPSSDTRAQGAAAERDLAAVEAARTEVGAAVAPTAPPPAAVPMPLEAAKNSAADAALRREVVTEQRAGSAGSAAAQLRLDDAIEYITAAEAERRGIRTYVIPELEVLRIGLRGEELQVEQKLPDGKLVTVIITRAGTTPRVRLTAALSEDSLRVLAAKVK